MFKNGDATKLDLIKWDNKAKEQVDGHLSSIGNDVKGRGGVINSNGKDIGVIFLDDSTVKSPQDMIQTLAHELGHVIDFAMIKYNPELRRLVDEAWRKSVSYIANKGSSGFDWLLKNGSLSFTRKGDKVFPNSTLGIKSIQPNQRLFTSTQGMEPNSYSSDEYRLSRDEWMAEQIARWFQTNETPVSAVDKYFKWIADVYRRFFEHLKSKGFYPNDTVSQIMDRFVEQAKGKRVAQQMSTNTRENAIAELRAYHGSPYVFDKFSTESIGKGEGYQAFGWGLYFTSSRKIAEFYRDKLSNPDKYKVTDSKGESVDWLDILDMAKSSNIIESDLDKSALHNAFSDLKFHGYEEALKQAQDMLDKFKSRKKEDWANEELGYKLTNEQSQIVEYIKLLKKLVYDKRPYKYGATYQV
jgi:hypothetical protein